jgi:uncharacterized membrane protein YtjA (UPF0391 family)
MRGLAILFAILTIIFGIWAFGTGAAVVWAGAQVLFWVFLVLFVLSLLGGWAGGWGPPARPPV